MEPLQPHQSRWYRRTDPQGRALLALLLPLAGVYLCQLVTLQEPAAAWACWDFWPPCWPGCC